MPSHWGTFKRCLSYCDLFGQKLELTYDKEVYYRTYYGALYTLLIFAFLIFQAIAGYKDLTTRLNPVINMMEVEEDRVTEIDILNDNVTIALGFVSDNRSNYLYDPSYFTIDAKYMSKSKEEAYDVTNSNQLDVGNCGHEGFKGFDKIYDTFDLYKALCLNAPKTVDKVSIYSSPRQFKEAYLKISLKYCTGDNCHSPEEISQRLKDLNLYLYITHDYFDGTDINNPIKRRLSMQKWTFDDLFARRKDSLYLTSGTLKDYNSLFMSLFEATPEHFITFEETDIIRNFKFTKLSDEPKKFIDIYIKAQAAPLKIIRKYTTVIDLVATLGGLFNFFFLVGNLIFSYIGKFVLDIRMINDHFNIIKSDKRPDAGTELNEIKEGESKSKRSSISPFDSLKSDNISNVSYIPKKSKNENNPKLSPLLKTNNHNYKLHYSLTDILYSLLCIRRKSLTRKNEIYDKCKQIVDNYLDIKNLITLIQELKVMRSVLFDKIQLSLINFYKKPILKIDKGKNNKMFMVYRKSITSDDGEQSIHYEGDDNLFHYPNDTSDIPPKIADKLDILHRRYQINADKIDRKILDLVK